MTWHFIGLKKISLFIVGYVLVATLAEILAPILLGSAFVHFDLVAGAQPCAEAFIFSELDALCTFFGALLPFELSNFFAGGDVPDDQVLLSLHELFAGDKVGVTGRKT